MRLNHFERCAGVLVAALVLAATVSARTQKETENFDRTVAFPAGGSLELHNFSGNVHITGTTGKDLVIHAVRRAERDRLDRIKLDVATSGSTIVVEANKRDSNWHSDNDNVVETTFEIQVPASAKVTAEVFSSDVDIKAVSGPLHLNTFSGRITIDAVAAGAAPNVWAKTFSGDITARLAESAKVDVNFSSFSGRFDSDLPVSVRTMGGRGRSKVSGTVSGGGSPLSFETFSGDVQIKK